MSLSFQRNNRDFITGITAKDGANSAIESFGCTLNAMGHRTQGNEENGRVV